MNIGILGAGSFGEKHINVIQHINDFNIIGFFDPNKERAKSIEKKYQIKSFRSEKELIDQCEAIDIVSSTETHYKLLQLGIQNNKHIFIEKPICCQNDDILQLLQTTKTYKPIIQVGHIERYNPVIQHQLPHIKNIQSITSKRTGNKTIRNKNQSITLDLMIHDIELVMHIFQSTIKEISIIKKEINESQWDNIIAKLVFKNGKVAELTCQRSNEIKIERKMIIRCINDSIEIDLLNRVVKTKEKEWVAQKNANPLQEEFMDFKKNINNYTRPKVGVKEACQAVQIALEIDKKLNTD